MNANNGSYILPQTKMPPLSPNPEPPVRTCPTTAFPSKPTAFFSWNHVSERMKAARNYWIGATRPDGRPHVTPVWGVWLDDTFYFGAGRNSRKARNLAANPAIVVHLESGDDVVILEGLAERLTAMDPALYERIAAGYAAKYAGFRPNPPSKQEPLFAVHPQVVFAWLESDFVRTAARWRLSFYDTARRTR